MLDTLERKAAAMGFQLSPMPTGKKSAKEFGGMSMRDIRVGAAQFEHRNGDKAYNLSRIET